MAAVYCRQVYKIAKITYGLMPAIYPYHGVLPLHHP